MSIIRDTINERFGGKLRYGSHSPDGMACALEARAIALGLEWTDSPRVVQFPDLRPINDRYGDDDDARTAALIPVMETLWDWPDWPKEKRVAWAKVVALRTIKEIVPIALRAAGLDDHAVKCEQAETLEAGREACRNAADAAAYANANAAADAADAAADYADAAANANADYADAAAYAAAYARAATKRNEVLDKACRIWIEAVPQEVAA